MNEEPTTNQTDTQRQPTRSRRKPLLIIAAVAVALLIGAAVATAYYLSNDPQRLLKQAMNNLSTQPALDADFTAVNLNGEKQTAKGDLSYRRDSDTPKDFEFAAGVRENDARLGLTFRSVNDTYYARVSGLDRLSAFSASAEERANLENPVTKAYLNGLNDTWFRFSRESVQQLLASGEAANKDQEFDAEDREKLEDIYERHQFLKIEDKGDATIGGTQTRHLLLSIDHAKYISFLEELKDADVAFVNLTDERLDSERNNKEEIENIRTETWIADADKTFKQMKFYDASKTEESFTLTFQPVEAGDINIEAPDNAEDLTQLLQLFSQNS